MTRAHVTSLIALAVVFAGPGRARLASAADPASGPSAVEAPAYAIGASDVLHIDVFGEPTLTGDFTVDAQGLIVFPLIGDIHVGGESVVWVKDRVAELLKRDYMHEPQVTVVIKEFRSKKVRILGAVQKPGIYFIDGPLRLFDLLSRAEGVAAKSGEIRKGQMARIARRAPGSPAASDDGEEGLEKIYVDLHDLVTLGLSTHNLLLQDGDVIYVPESESVHVIGEVKKPGSYPHEAGMTALKAITLAGGATSKGSVKGAVIKRIEDGKEVRLKAKPEDLVLPDDILEVPLSFW